MPLTIPGVTEGESATVRRLAGAAAVIVVLALCLLAFRFMASPPSGSYEVRAILGEAGTNLSAGSDVKVRDVAVGTVARIDLDDQARAVATLVIWPRYRIPEDVDVTVNSKTLLGERYVELVPHGPLDEGAALSAGDVLRTDDERVVEVQDLVDAIDPLLAAIDPLAAGRIIDELGSFTPDDARIAARNLEVGAELADFGAATAEEQIDRLSAVADLTGELARAADDWNRLDRSLPRWVSLLPDRQAAIRTNLEALSSFSLTLAEFLEVKETTIAELLRATTVVNGVIAAQPHELASLVDGIAQYAFKFSVHGGSLNDGTEHGYFRVFIGGEGSIQQLCASLPAALRANAPGCVDHDRVDQSDEGDTDEQEPEDEASEDEPDEEPPGEG